MAKESGLISQLKNDSRSCHLLAELKKAERPDLGNRLKKLFQRSFALVSSAFSARALNLEDELIEFKVKSADGGAADSSNPVLLLKKESDLLLSGRRGLTGQSERGESRDESRGESERCGESTRVYAGPGTRFNRREGSYDLKEGHLVVLTGKTPDFVHVEFGIIGIPEKACVIVDAGSLSGESRGRSESPAGKSSAGKTHIRIASLIRTDLAVSLTSLSGQVQSIILKAGEEACLFDSKIKTQKLLRPAEKQ